MGNAKSLDNFFTGVESKLSLLTMLWGIPAVIASFALPAWAVKASKVLEAYSPLSWVSAGFIGLFVSSLIYLVLASAKARWVRARYDARMLAIGGALDPLDKTFERKRIYINEFCLPSHPLIEDKSFIDCEIIGPANVLFVEGNNISQGKYPVCDAVWLKSDVIPNGIYLFKNCIFKGCNFSRVTFFVPYDEKEMFRTYALVRWITNSPYDQGELNLISGEQE